MAEESSVVNNEKKKFKMKENGKYCAYDCRLILDITHTNN